MKNPVDSREKSGDFTSFNAIIAMWKMLKDSRILTWSSASPSLTGQSKKYWLYYKGERLTQRSALLWSWTNHWRLIERNRLWQTWNGWRHIFSQKLKSSCWFIWEEFYFWQTSLAHVKCWTQLSKHWMRSQWRQGKIQPKIASLLLSRQLPVHW